MKGVTYTLRNSLYVALTNASNAKTLMQTRGPAFAMPHHSNFAPLDAEPDAQQLLQAVNEALAKRDKPPDELVFAGQGEPLMRMRVLKEVATSLRDAQKLRMRVSTNGLVPSSNGASVARALESSGVSAVSVALATADAEQYIELMQPEQLRLTPVHSLELGLPDVTDFVRACVAAGLEVECNAVEAPGVDVEKAKELALELGATFRPRSWHA